MDEKLVLQKLGARTDNAVFLGVTGPTRTGKSTFVKRFMEELVLPNIHDPAVAERAHDELPQSASGRIVMTTEPKFVPEDAVEISPDGITHLSVRLIDTVGYPVEGVLGTEDDNGPRMVSTPWSGKELKMTDAAELSTRKMMSDHATLGIVVTTDGSITELPRPAYSEAEQKAISDMKNTGKPFVVLVNSVHPDGIQAQSIADQISAEYDVPALPVNCRDLTKQDILTLLSVVLDEFPITQIEFRIPDWIRALEEDHPVKAELYTAIRDCAESMKKIALADASLRHLHEQEMIQDVALRSVDCGSGCVQCELRLPERLFYDALNEKTGLDIHEEGELMRTLMQLSEVKKSYDKIETALREVQTTGYGVVPPMREEMKLEAPEIVKKGSAYAIRLKATAPSIHMIRTDVETELSPIIGDEKQSKEIAETLLTEYNEHSERVWQSKLFGKSLYDMVTDGLNGKLTQLPEGARYKFRNTLSRVVNDGANGMICILY